jgi:hypothetical protein
MLRLPLLCCCCLLGRQRVQHLWPLLLQC